MKRLLCAVAVSASLLAVARADEGAYRSLVGMARAAESERKPAPPSDADASADKADKTASAALDGAPSAAPAAGENLKDALSDGLDAGRTSAAASVPGPKGPGPAPRVWTRLYSTLMPSWRRMPVLASSYDAPGSTAAAAALRPLRSLVPPPDSEAVKAGERRGLAELLSSSVAPTDAK